MFECGMATAAMFSLRVVVEADLTSVVCGGSHDSVAGVAVVWESEREETDGRVRRPLPQAAGANRKL